MDDFVEIRMWGDRRLDFLRRFYPRERALPSHGVINALNPQSFETGFGNWVKGLRDELHEAVAIDGMEPQSTSPIRSCVAAATVCSLGKPVIVFLDDRARFRTANGPHDMAIIEHVNIDLIENAQTSTRTTSNPRPTHAVSLRRFRWPSHRRSNSFSISASFSSTNVGRP